MYNFFSDYVQEIKSEFMNFFRRNTKTVNKEREDLPCDLIVEMVQNDNGVYVERSYFRVQKTADLKDETKVHFDHNHPNPLRFRSEDIVDMELNEDNVHVVIDK